MWVHGLDNAKKLITVAILVLLVAGLGRALVVPAEAGHTGQGAWPAAGGHIKYSHATKSRSPQWVDCQRRCGDAIWGCFHELGYNSVECNNQVAACRKNCPPEFSR